jgi:flagellar FliL protein
MAAKVNPAETKANPAQAKPEKKKGGVSLIVVIVLVLVAAAGSAAGVWFLGPKKAAAADGTAEAAGGHAAAAHDDHGGDGKKKTVGTVEYFGLDPTFVVNTADEDTQHYLQTDVQVMTRSDAVVEQVKLHMPRIRNNLLLLFSAQHCADVRDRAGREKLQAAALKEVQDVLTAETGKPGVEALYFTSFVTQ